MTTTMLNSDIRLWNLRALAASVGGITKLAERIDKAQTMVSNMIGATPKRAIGSAIAEDVEKAFGKPPGWMDFPHPSLWRRIENPNWRDDAKRAAEEAVLMMGADYKAAADSYGQFHEELMQNVIEVVMTVFRERGLSLPPPRLAKLILLIYEEELEEMAEERAISKTDLEGKVVRMVRYASKF